MLKKLILLVCLPLLVAISQGCYSTVESGAYLAGLGFASDTTAILFYELWDIDGGGIPYRSHREYYGWELRLVDVRFNKVYWKAQINHNHSNTQILRGAQWNDSTMLIELTDRGYWLWTVGSKKPQKVDFKWNAEKKNDIFYSYKWLKWKNNSFLLFSDFPSSRSHLIIDAKAMTVNYWSPTGENAWTVACDAFWWGNNGEACLINKPYGFTLLSKEGDTLGNFTYAHECATYYDRKCNIKSSFYYNFIMASLGECENDVCRAYPVKRTINVESHALIRYDSEWNIDKEPSFWMHGGRKFVDSLGNITEY